MKSLLFRTISGLSAAKALGDGLSIPDAASITAGGTGYAVNDIVTLAGAGAVYAGPSTWRVKSVGAGGVVTAVEVVRSGGATTKPPAPTAVTGGSGSGLTLAVTWRDNSIPHGVKSALIQPETQSVRWRDDGTAPTAAAGQLIVAGDSILYDFETPGAVKLIEVVASATVNVTFFG